jgi:hypothetical protein
MNLFQSIALAALISGLVAGTALADDTSSSSSSPQANSTTDNSDTIHIGETYQEHLQNEMNKNAALAQQGQQPKQDPQRIGKPVEIDGTNQ